MNVFKCATSEKSFAVELTVAPKMKLVLVVVILTAFLALSQGKTFLK